MPSRPGLYEQAVRVRLDVKIGRLFDHGGVLHAAHLNVVSGREVLLTPSAQEGRRQQRHADDNLIVIVLFCRCFRQAAITALSAGRSAVLAAGVPSIPMLVRSRGNKYLTPRPSLRLLQNVVVTVSDEGPSHTRAHHFHPKVRTVGPADRDRSPIAVYCLWFALDLLALHQIDQGTRRLRSSGPITTGLLALRRVDTPQPISRAGQPVDGRLCRCRKGTP